MTMCDDKQQAWGLVPVKPADAAAEWFKQDNDVKTSKGRGSQYNLDGYAAGKNVSLSKGVTAQSGTLRIN